MVKAEISFPLPFGRRRWIRRQVPQTWNELTPQQLLAVAPALFHRDEGQRKLLLLKTLFGLKWRQLLVIQAETLAIVSDMAGFLLGENTLTKNLLPSLTVGWRRRTFYGPADSFRNIRFNEFVFADNFFLHYQKTGRLESLDKLVAVLYRPQRKDYRPLDPDYEGDRREDFNESLLPTRTQQLAGLSIAHKLAVYHYYAGNRTALAKAVEYEKCFSGSEENSKESQPWLQMARNLPNDKFGPILEIQRHKLKFILFHLNGIIKDAQAEAARQKQKPQA